MVSHSSLLGFLCYLLLMPGLFEASSLVRVKKPEGNVVSIDSAQAHDFLTNSRPKRNIDPKWHRGNPDFQSYYRFYNSIGHIEGLYEIDRIRMLYQQMRHLELTYGPDASSYQNALGVLTTTAALTTTTTQPTPPPTTPAPTPDPLEKAQRFYLCHPKDPLCKPQVVYLPSGAVPALCDPRLHTCNAKTEEEIKAAAPPETPPPPPPAPEKAAQPPPPPAIVFKGMEYDCDPYWDPDCLIEHPPRPILGTVAPEAPAAAKGE
ncbi:mucin-7-like, partial [Gouania willdenowi]|uniref:mucin-7-like n=1 Tax=Gouania willdenowi TaxID=441366 RepID=UPI001056B38F